MTTDTSQGAAKIYQFPTGGRASLATAREGFKPAADLQQRAPSAAFGSGWYHEAAIEESRRAFDH